MKHPIQVKRLQSVLRSVVVRGVAGAIQRTASFVSVVVCGYLLLSCLSSVYTRRLL